MGCGMPNTGTADGYNFHSPGIRSTWRNAMTDEERQRLCKDLRTYNPRLLDPWAMCDQAADEIERLAKELAEKDELIRVLKLGTLRRAE
jgi:hypothetical protein